MAQMSNMELMALSLDGKAEAESRKLAPAQLVAAINGIASESQRLKDVSELAMIETLRKTLTTTGKTQSIAHQGACAITSNLLKTVGRPAIPFLIPLVEPLMNLSGDKTKNTKDAADAAVSLMFETVCEELIPSIVPELLKPTTSWQATEARMNHISSLCAAYPRAMSQCLHDAVPGVATVLHDVNAKVKVAARQALAALCKTCTNEDIVPLVPILMSALERQNETADCVHKFASTTFVQVVDSATLSVMAPILIRGFNVQQAAVKRACARIVENMCKLVEQPRDLAANFLPRIGPLLDQSRKSVANPEAREVCEKAYAILIEKAAVKAPAPSAVTVGFLKNALKDCDTKIIEVAMFDATVTSMVTSLVESSSLEADKWNELLMPFLAYLVEDKGKAQGVVDLVREEATKLVDAADAQAEEVDEDPAEDLCNCLFSLAYGNKVLLRKTKLRLKRGHKYGLIGKNDSGKTSLMRAIADHRVEGFPDEDTLRTVFVETDIKVELADLTVIEYMEQDTLLQKMNLTRERFLEALESAGFNEKSPANITTCVGKLSGGWRMKLALARAMLLNADILLLDEPTNHLDSYNVKWVENYLMGLKNVTCVMVSHDSGFLNRCCGYIVQIENFRLSLHKGNLEAFVAKRPDAKAFFELKTNKFAFKFPPPSRLQGINSKGKAIMKMTDISFTYPGAEKAQLKNVTIQVSLGSRVACVGVNGAGKSTMIKLLTGELLPDQGSGAVWTHPNMTYGYIAQHAFHHIEHHLEKTANEYICWRYRHGNDREALNKATNAISEAEEKVMKKEIMFEMPDPNGGPLPLKVKGVVGRLTESRRDNKMLKDQEYELSFTSDEHKMFWVPRAVLVKAGWEKILKQVDDRITIRAAMFSRPLTQENVKSHLADVGLEEEFSTHTRIGALSGGQKVKVVLAAALWNRPHVLILDEPTNYLDRDSLGALAGAIREFEGGVVMITHNSQFCDDLCPQVWHLEHNTLNVKGDAEWMAMDIKLEAEKKVDEAETDRFGNKITVKKELNTKEARAAKKLKEAKAKARRKAGLPSDDEDDE